MPPATEVSTLKLISYVYKLRLWTNMQQNNVTILYHMSTLFSCKNNFFEMVKCDKNVLPYDAERSNSRLIKHRAIEHNIVSCLNAIERGEMGM